MAERISSSKRISMQNVAEREVMRYAGDHALWHKHVHNVDLDPMQVLKCIDMDQHKNTIDFSCRRSGKTAIKETYQLKQNATNADQELGIIAPRLAQSQDNLDYHLDAIDRSEILSSFIDFKRGRRQLADTYYQFANRSKAQAFGIMSQVDGGDMTAASLEEVDDMPRKRLFSNFLLRMGSTRRMGASKESKNDPEIRITGVFKGADTLSSLISSGEYYVLPTVNVYLGMEMGVLGKQYMMSMQSQLSPDEYIRQLLCINVSSRNLVWEKHVRRAMQVGLDAGIELAQPLPGMTYKKKGMISFGYDAGGHGEDPQSSEHALVVLEQIGNFTCVIFCKTWAPGADDNVVKADLLGFWRYFNPDFAMGDAYGVGMLTDLNDQLFSNSLTTIDRRAIGDGDSTASTWPEWPFSPIRFEGMVKHQMAVAVRTMFHTGHAAIPYFDDLDLQDLDTADLRKLVRQIPNIKPIATKASYASYKMANPKLKDDCFDALMAAVWALVTRGAAPMATTIKIQTKTREQLLGLPAAITH